MGRPYLLLAMISSLKGLMAQSSLLSNLLCLPQLLRTDLPYVYHLCIMQTRMEIRLSLCLRRMLWLPRELAMLTQEMQLQAGSFTGVLALSLSFVLAICIAKTHSFLGAEEEEEVKGDNVKADQASVAESATSSSKAVGASHARNLVCELWYACAALRHPFMCVLDADG